jgi:hypothetical protein
MLLEAPLPSRVCILSLSFPQPAMQTGDLLETVLSANLLVEYS